jgi:mRNA deadenylase 3'-5' endonuclease subunit Ccr4
MERGLTEDWDLWVQQHPHRELPVDIHIGMQRRFGPSAAELSVVSWNTLSKTWLEKGRDDTDYVNVPLECFDWSSRSQQLVAGLLALDADVILLQEVDFEVFQDSFMDPLSQAGYQGIMQNDIKRAEEQPCGNATFWKTDKLQLQWAEHRSRTLITGFSVLCAPSAGSRVTVINAHLESSQSKFGQRASQLHSALGKVRSSDAVILGGDFNTGTDSPINAVLRNFRWHGHALAAAYEHPAAETTAQASECTFAVSGGHRYSIDHILYSHEKLRPTALLEALPEDLRFKCLGVATKGLPDMHVPSDHIPVGAIFAVSPTSADLPAIIEMPKTKAEETLLWNSSNNPLSIEQQQTWLMLCNECSSKPNGRPTPEEIKARGEEKKARLAKVQDFVVSLPAEARAFLGFFKDDRAALKRLTA